MKDRKPVDSTRTVELAINADSVERPLRHRVARAAVASGVTETATRALTIVLSIATARALSPSQVGVLGLAVIVTGIVSLIAACCETAGVVTNSHGTDSQHAMAAAELRGLVTAALVIGVLVGLGGITRRLGGAEGTESEVSELIRILVWLPVLEIVACLPRVFLQRKLDLTCLSGIAVLQTGVYVGLSIGLLWEGYGAKGVAWSAVIAAGLSTVAVWLRILGRSHSRRGLLPDFEMRRKVWAQTARVFVGGFVGYLNGRLDNLFVAGTVGPTAMSFYGMAWNASRIAPQILGQAVGFVLVPTLAQIQADNARVRRAVGESIQHAYLLLTPVAAITFVSSPSLVSVVLGNKWLPMIPCLQVMSVTILAVPVVFVTNAFLLATGRAHLAGLASLGQLLALAASIIPLSKRWGIVGAAFGDLAAVFVLTISFLALSPLIRNTVRDRLLNSIIVPMVAAAVAAAVAWTASTQLSVGSLKLLLQVGVVLAAYPAALSLLGGTTALVEVIALTRNALRRVGAGTGVAVINHE